MRPLGDALADRGYTVMGINLPGHATTEADMATTNWKQWLDAARNAALKLKKSCDKVTVAGLSDGRCDCADPCRGGAARRVRIHLGTDGNPESPDPLCGASLAVYSQGQLGRLPGERHQQLDSKFDFGYSGFPTAKAADLRHLIRMARRSLGSVECPLLVVQSTGDQTIWLGSSDCIIQSVRKRNEANADIAGCAACVHHIDGVAPRSSIKSIGLWRNFEAGRPNARRRSTNRTRHSNAGEQGMIPFLPESGAKSDVLPARAGVADVLP